MASPRVQSGRLAQLAGRSAKVGRLAALQRAALQRAASGPSHGEVLQGEFTSTGNRDTHFTRHGTEFGATSTEGYSTAADTHYANRASYQSKSSGGKLYVYDSATDTLGVYNSSGKTITLFKPGRGNAVKGQRYYNRQ